MTVINTNTSNYILNTTNLLKEFTDNKIADTFNYIVDTSNIISVNFNSKIQDSSNYIHDSSKIFIGEIKNTSNYGLNTSNYAATNIKRITDK